LLLAPKRVREILTQDVVTSLEFDEVIDYLKPHDRPLKKREGPLSNDCFQLNPADIKNENE